MWTTERVRARSPQRLFLSVSLRDFRSGGGSTPAPSFSFLPPPGLFLSRPACNAAFHPFPAPNKKHFLQSRSALLIAGTRARAIHLHVFWFIIIIIVILRFFFVISNEYLFHRWKPIKIRERSSCCATSLVEVERKKYIKFNWKIEMLRNKNI